MSMLNWWKAVSLVSLFCALATTGSPATTFTTLASFNVSENGAIPLATLVQGLDGNLYGTTQNGGASGFGIIFSITPAGTLSRLHSFDGAGGIQPEGLVLAINGFFYGTTALGGASDFGTIFKITPAGKLTTLYSFCSQPGCTDGGILFARLARAFNGNFYGTTYQGGANGDGTVFKITPAGMLTTLYSFCSQPGCTDGAVPLAGLMQATNGNLYGTTMEGGAKPGGEGSGTVFRITSGGRLITLYRFCSQPGCTNGGVPVAGLMQATDGNLYGTTSQAGGANNCRNPAFCGTLFEITPRGTLTTL